MTEEDYTDIVSLTLQGHLGPQIDKNDATFSSEK